MADLALPNDGYVAYYTEKIWNLIPAEYRRADFVAENPGVLRAFVEVLASQAAVLRRSGDRLWDDVFIDLCDDWAVPYLGDLVGTRLISALDRRGRRVDVAKTIYYRRRKGTLRVLEELIGDITGWDGTVTESFRSLARMRHGLDPAPEPLAGRYSRTPPGGWADLRRPFASTLADGPFDEYAHTPDVRRQRGFQGRWNIPKIVFHLFRLTSYRVTGATAVTRADGATFLFIPPAVTSRCSRRAGGSTITTRGERRCRGSCRCRSRAACWATRRRNKRWCRPRSASISAAACPSPRQPPAAQTWATSAPPPPA